MFALILSLILSSAQAAPTTRSYYDNGIQAQQLNANFTTLKASDPCTGMSHLLRVLKPLLIDYLIGTSFACIQNGFAQCNNGSWEVTPCPQDLICAALPSVGSESGTVSVLRPAAEVKVTDAFVISGDCVHLSIGCSCAHPGYRCIWRHYWP